MSHVAHPTLGRLDALEEDSRAKFRQKSMANSRKKTHGLAVTHPELGYYCIAPVLEGRIVNIQEEAEEGAVAQEA